MKFTIASSIATLILSCDQTMGMNFLQKRMLLGEPNFTYDDLTFTAEFTTSDFFEDKMISYSLYDGKNCRDGGDNDITENQDYLLSRIRHDNTPLGDGGGTRTIKVETQIVPTNIVKSPIYSTDEDENAVVEYCIRFGIFTMGGEMEANFLEIPVTLTIVMETEFSIDAVLSNIGPLLEENDRGVAVEAYICDFEDNLVPIMPTNQGQNVRVCVSPTAKTLASGALLRQLEQFTFRREIPVSASQVAIKSGTGGVAADGLTVVSCQPGSTVCAFETLLKADFFRSEGVIVGQGQAFLQLGTNEETEFSRRLEGGSVNQELAKNPTSFTVIIELVNVDSVRMELLTDSAPTMGISYIVTALLTMGSVLLL